MSTATRGVRLGMLIDGASLIEHVTPVYVNHGDPVDEQTLCTTFRNFKDYIWGRYAVRLALGDVVMNEIPTSDTCTRRLRITLNPRWFDGPEVAADHD